MKYHFPAMRSVGCFTLLVISVPSALLKGINAEEGAVSHLGNGRIFSWVRDTAYQEGELTTIDIDSVRCQMNDDCTPALPGLAIAIGTGSKIPKSPICVLPDNDLGNHDAISKKNSSGHCSCGPGNCVSYSMEYGSDIPFYYCGPCARLGSQCSNGTCDHEMAECREDYCQCYKSGFFYEFNYCEIPFVLYETSLQICIIIIIAIVSLLIVTSLCTAIGLDRYWRNRRSSSGNSEVSNRDTPPAYDEVMDSLPSYQDALQMAQEDNGNHDNELNTTPTSSRTDERPSDVRGRLFTPSANSSNDEVSSSSLDNDHLQSSQRYQPIEMPLRQQVNL
ncbi:uncharacterized protein [Palaemon carinicauda]|uniref:uncharacterized protein isoform X2 n=1 Tax=Palaemon carinicauda TaxID=392227 RepID=UPI0035B6970D